MKSFTLLVAYFILFSGIAFAENPSGDIPKNDNTTKAPHSSVYKSSPRLNYSSNKPEKDDSISSSLKPMLNQVMGNNNNNATGGVGMPTGAKYNF